MMRRMLSGWRGWVLVVCGMLALPAFAVDYKSVTQHTVLFDGPSDKSSKVAIIARGTPVELVVVLDRWAKVRDADGTLLWVDRRLLSDKRTLIVTVAKAEIRREPSESAPLAFEAAKNVVLEWQEPGPLGWVKVRHADGQSGYVRITQVWGV